MGHSVCILLSIALLASSTLDSASAQTPTDSAKTIQTAFGMLKSKASENSPEIRAAQSTLSQKTAQRYASWTRWLPRLDLELAQSRSQDFSIVQSGALGNLGAFGFNFTPQLTDLSRWSLNLSMPIYRRSVHLGVQQSIVERNLAEADYDARRTELDWRLRSLFGAYLLSRYREATLENSLELGRTNLKEAKLRFELGQRTRIDVLRSQANLVTLETRKLNTLKQRESDLLSLLSYTGLSSDDFVALKIEPSLTDETRIAAAIDGFTDLDALSKSLGPLLELPRVEIEGRIASGNLTYRSSVLSQELADSRARNLMAQEYPELRLQGSLSKQSQTGFSDAFSGGNNSHSIAVVLDIPIFSSGSLVSSYLEKENAQDANRFKQQLDATRLRDEILSQILQAQALQKNVESLTLILDQNTELVRLTQKSYQLGKSSISDLLASQNDLNESKINLAQAKLDLSVLYRRIAWNLGAPQP